MVTCKTKFLIVDETVCSIDDPKYKAKGKEVVFMCFFVVLSGPEGYAYKACEGEVEGAGGRKEVGGEEDEAGEKDIR